MKLYYISWIPAATIMIMIFCFSSKAAEASGESSIAVANTVLAVYENIADSQYEQQDRQETLERIDHYIRKTAHFCEYALLACAIVLHLLVLKITGIRLWLLPVLISAIYAATDEYHQTFVEGRSGQLSDVLLDTAGAATGTLIFYTIIFLSQRRKQKKHSTLLQ